MMRGSPKVPTTAWPAYWVCRVADDVSSVTRQARLVGTTHNASLGTTHDCLMAFGVEMLEQTRQCTRHAVDLGKEVL